MSTQKHLGIYMDHASAHMMEYTSEPNQTKTITSKFTHAVKEHSLSEGEKREHNIQQQEEGEYYKQLRGVILKYDEVVLFGPTHAKTELLHTLKTNHLFAKIMVETKNTDSLSEAEQHAYVKDYFIGCD